MCCQEMASAYNLDPQTQVQVAEMQRETPWMFPGYTYSSDSDAEDNGQDRVQPEIAAILANIQPRCARYFNSSCKDYLIAGCSNFRLRYMWAVWNDHCQEAYAERCFARSAERSWVREAREIAEAAARDEIAAAPAANSQASTPVAS